MLKNLFYAGVYAYGKIGRQAKIRDGRAHVTYKNRKSPEDWVVVIRAHHVGYIDWEEYERNQAQLAKNAFGRAGGVRSDRGGEARYWPVSFAVQDSVGDCMWSIQAVLHALSTAVTIPTFFSGRNAASPLVGSDRTSLSQTLFLKLWRHLPSVPTLRHVPC